MTESLLKMRKYHAEMERLISEGASEKEFIAVYRKYQLEKTIYEMQYDLNSVIVLR